MVLEYKGHVIKAAKVSFDISNECGIVMHFEGEVNGFFEGVEIGKVTILETALC